jgi:hypothetical protein
MQDAFEKRDAAEAQRAGGSRADAAPALQGPSPHSYWQRAALAEASARRLLQALLMDYYGVAADSKWLQSQGISVEALLAEDAADGVPPGLPEDLEPVSDSAGGDSVAGRPKEPGPERAADHARGPSVLADHDDSRSIDEGESSREEPEERPGLLGRLFGL